MDNEINQSRLVISGDDNQMHFNTDWFQFSPQPDITIWELANVLASLEIAISEDVLHNLPAPLVRHFTKKGDE